MWIRDPSRLRLCRNRTGLTDTPLHERPAPSDLAGARLRLQASPSTGMVAIDGTRVKPDRGFPNLPGFSCRTLCPKAATKRPRALARAHQESRRRVKERRHSGRSRFHRERWGTDSSGRLLLGSVPASQVTAHPQYGPPRVHPSAVNENSARIGGNNLNALDVFLEVARGEGPESDESRRSERSTLSDSDRGLKGRLGSVADGAHQMVR